MEKQWMDTERIVSRFHDYKLEHQLPSSDNVMFQLAGYFCGERQIILCGESQKLYEVAAT